MGIYLTVNAGRPTVHGWGAAMSTDTAFALGMLAMTGPRFPDRVRAFLLSVAVVDDLASLFVIGAAYTKALALVPLAVALGIFAVILILRRARIRYGIVYALLGIAAWVAVLKSGIDPVVVGLVMGLLTFAYPAARTDLERASDLFRSFREQPTPDLAQSARAGLASARRCHPMSGSSSFTIPGPVTSLCPCLRWPTPGSPSAAPSSPARTPPRSPSGS